MTLALVLALLAQDPYPLSHQLRTLEKDLESPDYRAVLGTMIPTDLDAEWQRVATPDNYHAFALRHGGLEAVGRDPALKKAYDRRKAIAARFLDLLRPAFKAKRRRVPYDDEAVLARVLERADRRGELNGPPQVRIHPVFSAPGAEKHWPGFRGPTGRGVVFDPRLPARWSAAENVVWRSKLPGPGNSSPVLWGDRLFLTATEGEDPKARLLLCYDRKTGALLWKHAAPPPAELEKVYGKNTFASSTPVTDGERVIVFFGNSGLLACDLDGKRLWHRDLGTFPTTHGPGTTPVLYKDLVILVQDQNKGRSLFAAFDKRTGEERWRRERKNAMCWTSPVLLRVDDRDELVYNGSHEVIGYDPATGEILWKVAGPSEEAVPMIAAGGGLLYSVSGRNGPSFAFRAGGTGELPPTHVVWRNERGGPHVPSPVFHDGRLYFVSDTGIFACLDAATGATLYQERLRGRFTASPLVVGGTIFLLNEEGLATLVKAGPAFEVLAENALNETTYATPAVLDGRIYFRTREHVICVGAASEENGNGGEADWPAWRGAGRDGKLSGFKPPAAWPETLGRSWSVEVGGGHSTPALVDGRLYVHARQGEEEVALCLDAAAGKQVWRTPYAAPYKPAQEAETHGHGPFASPAVEGNRVFTFGVTGILSCFDAKTGGLVWRQDSKAYPEWGASMSPLVADGLVIAHVGGKDKGAIVALEAATGKERWKWEGDGPGYASPVIGTFKGKTYLITQTQKLIVGLDAATGALLWKLDYATDFDQNSVTPVLFEGGAIFSGYKKGTTAYKLGGVVSPEQLWHSDLSMYMSTPVLKGDRLYGFTDARRGQFFCLNAKTGETLWTSDGRQGENAALLDGGGVILALTTGAPNRPGPAQLVVFDASDQGFAERARYKVADGPVWAHPVVAGGAVYVKDEKALTRWTIP